jgi:hypothetical protein
MRHPAFWVVAVAITLAHSPLGVERAAGAPQASQTQSSSGTHDLSGVWFVQGKVRAKFTFGGNSPLLPWGAERLKASQQKVSPVLLCFPPGVPRVWTMPFPFEIISLPGRVLIYYEYQHLVRQIHTDGREHPNGLIPTWMGNSIGKWEGDTLVVDTTGFNDQTLIDGTRLPHSDALHVVERIGRVSHEVLQVDITIDDPKAYAKPWTAQRIFDLKPGWEISEQVCEENNTYLTPPDNAKPDNTKIEK